MCNPEERKSIVAPKPEKGAFMWFKEIYSSALLLFCTVIVMTQFFQYNTTLASKSPWIAFFIFWPALYWLSMVEGGQASLVGLPPVETRLFQKSQAPRPIRLWKLLTKEKLWIATLWAVNLWY